MSEKKHNQRTIIDRVEDSMNKLTDMDMGWWPVLSLRPSKNRDIDNSVLLKLSLVFGLPIGVIIFIPLLIITTFEMTATISPIIVFLISYLIGYLLFFLSYKITFAFFWNRRARRLRDESIDA